MQRKTALLCLMLGVVLSFAGSFSRPLLRGQCAVYGHVSAGEAEAKEMNEVYGQARDIKKKKDADTQDKLALLTNFEIIRQMPELPTGCEITALTMILNDYGFHVDKMTMASEYLPKVPADFYEGTDGRLYGPDMEAYFVGDPASGGYICGTGAIVSAAEAFLEERGSSLRAEDLTGTDAKDLYLLVDEGIPVLVWVTIGMEDRDQVQGWYTQAGEWMEWSRNDHGAVLIGCEKETVTIADPLSGLRVYARERFEHVFASRGSQCVALLEEEFIPKK